MSLVEIIIIYLSVGAPFGVYFYLQNRRQKNRSVLLLSSLLITVVWIGFALYMIRKRIFVPRVYFDNHPILDSNNSQLLEFSQKQLFDSLVEIKKQAIDSESFSLFAIRETIERFVGLTLEIKNSSLDAHPSQSELEIFRISNKDTKTKLGGICLHRRNFLRLQVHQIKARQDFVDSLENIIEKFRFANLSNECFLNLQTSSIELVTQLKDKEAIVLLKKLFNKKQNSNEINVRQPEDLWQKLPIKKSTALNQPTYSTQTTLLRKAKG